MEQLVRLLQFAFSNFGPLIVFYGVNHFYGLRTAIIASVVTSVVEIAYKLIKKVPLTGFFKFTVLITLIFGALDLWIQTPIFFRYESVITNIITGIYFGMTIWSEKSFIQEWSEKRSGQPMTNLNALLRCRILTGVWTIYFFIKAGVYVWVNQFYSIDQAMVFRSTVGTASFYILLGVSIVYGKTVLLFFQKRGFLPFYPE